MVPAARARLLPREHREKQAGGGRARAEEPRARLRLEPGRARHRAEEDRKDHAGRPRRQIGPGQDFAKFVSKFAGARSASKFHRNMRSQPRFALVFQCFVGSYTLRSAVDHMDTTTRNDGTTRGVRITVSRVHFCWMLSRFWHGNAPLWMPTQIATKVSKFPEMCGLVLWREHRNSIEICGSGAKFAGSKFAVKKNEILA